MPPIAIEKSKLLVLVTNDDLEEVKYARKARSVAETLKLDIFFLGKESSPDTASQLHRRLITLAGIAESQIVRTKYATSNEPTWIEVISNVIQPDDFVLCPLEWQGIHSTSQNAVSLKEQYGSHLIPASGMIHPVGNPLLRNFLTQLLNWSGILLILAVAFGLEANLDSQTMGMMRIIGEVVLVGVELFVLWFWYRFFQRQS